MSLRHRRKAYLLECPQFTRRRLRHKKVAQRAADPSSHDGAPIAEDGESMPPFARGMGAWQAATVYETAFP
jgi:hypothetical protein